MNYEILRKSGIHPQFVLKKSIVEDVVFKGWACLVNFIKGLAVILCMDTGNVL